MANGRIIAWRGREKMSRGRVEENAVKWICSGGDLSTPPALSLSDKMLPSKLCNLFAFPALNHCASKPLTPLPRFSLSLSPDCLSAQQLQNSIFTFHTCFGVIRINCPLLLRNIYESGYKGHRWSKQLSRDLTSDVSLHNLTWRNENRDGLIWKGWERKRIMGKRADKERLYPYGPGCFPDFFNITVVCFLVVLSSIV